MFKAFLDANVWFAAARSPQGGSALVIELAKQKKIKIYTSLVALNEVEKNIRQKEPLPVLLRHYQNLTDVKPKIIPINRQQAIKHFAKIINPKDSLILAAAIKSQAEYLVTLDRKHFMSPRLQKDRMPIKIVLPGDFLKVFLP